MVQVRDVPAGVHAVLVQRAERRGLSLSAYLREVLTQLAQTAALDEVLDALPPLNVKIGPQEVVDALHAERAGRESRWS